jgi:hypothetical protein
MFLMQEMQYLLRSWITNVNNEGTWQKWAVVSLNWNKSLNFISCTWGVVTSSVGGHIVTDRVLGSNPSRPPLGMRKEKHFTVFFIMLGVQILIFGAAQMFVNSGALSPNVTCHSCQKPRCFASFAQDQNFVSINLWFNCWTKTVRDFYGFTQWALSFPQNT